MKRDLAIHVVALGANITTSGASANAAIPVTSAGTKPYYIRVTATAAAYVKLGTSGAVAAVAGDMIVQPGDSVILSVGGSSGGSTHIAALQVTAAGIVNVAPLEDQ